MGKFALLQLLLKFFVLALVVVAETGQKWKFKQNELIPEKLTHLHFYYHETVTGKNPTVVLVALAPSITNSTTGFGIVNMVDDPLREGPEPTSKRVGRAQGLYGFAGQQETGLIVVLSFWFTDGVYNGSSLSVVGLNHPMRSVRELSVVGGTGVFGFARGIALLKTYAFNATSFNAIVEYNVTVVHY